MPKPGVLRTLGRIHKDSRSLPTGIWIQEANPESPGPHSTVRDLEGAKRGQLRDSPDMCALTREKAAQGSKRAMSRATLPLKHQLQGENICDVGHSRWSKAFSLADLQPRLSSWLPTQFGGLGPAQGLIHKSHSSLFLTQPIEPRKYCSGHN